MLGLDVVDPVLVVPDVLKQFVPRQQELDRNIKALKSLMSHQT